MNQMAGIRITHVRIQGYRPGHDGTPAGRQRLT
ncbi:hypothetical protein ACTMU2_08075 [Cupriavidus basilensis]